MELSSGIAYIAGLTHEIYAEQSVAKWYFMMYRVVELFNRVKGSMPDEPTQVVVLACFQIIAKAYDEPAMTNESLWNHAVCRMEMKLELVKTDEKLELVHLRILEAANHVIKPEGGAGPLPVQGSVCKIHFNGAHRFCLSTAWESDATTDERPPKIIRGQAVVSMNR
jgi:hypothetical protein